MANSGTIIKAARQKTARISVGTKTARADTARPDTRERLIAVAVRHFGRSGFEGASLREIQREAQVNSAATHYHFGSKEALYQGVFEQFLSVIQAERLALLEHFRFTRTHSRSSAGSFGIRLG